MSRFARAVGGLITNFKQTTAPTVAQGLTLGDIWVDTDASPMLAYACSATGPVTFINATPATSVAESDVVFTDITTNNASTTKHGYLKKLSNISTEFMNGAGNWAASGGSPNTTKGDIAGYSTVSARVPIGADGTRIEADSAQALGVRWDYASPNPKKSVTFYTEFMANPVNKTDWTYAAGSSGTGSSGTLAADLTPSGGTNLGVVQQDTGTTTTGSAYFIPTASIAYHEYFIGGGQTIVEAAILLPTLSDGTDTYTVAVGMIDTGVTPNATPTDGAYLLYSSIVNSGNWVGRTVSAGVVTTVNSATPPSTTLYQRIRIVINATATSAEFFLDDVSFGTSSTNLPATSGINLRPTFWIKKSAGTTSRTQNCDYFIYRKDFTTAR